MRSVSHLGAVNSDLPERRLARKLTVPKYPFKKQTKVLCVCKTGVTWNY